MADESSSTTSRPNNDRSVIVFGGFTRYKQPSVRDDGATVSQIEWFSIDVPDADADADSHCQKQKLNPRSVMEIEKECYFAALDSSIYCISSHRYHDRVQIFDLTGGDIDGWQPGPPSIVSRVGPHKFVVDGKLYILGGLRKVDSPWMEVLDPKIGVWKPLPNPPEEIGNHSRNVVALLLKPKKQILVSSFLSQHTPDDRPLECRFLTYNIDDQSWEPLDTPVSNCKLRRCCGFRPRTSTALADGDTLYWVSFDYLARHELVIHAYNLITDEWFEGYLDTCGEIFGKKELLAEHRPHGLLHLGHSKFCLLLQSSFIPNSNKRQRQREQYIEIPYLYCVIIVVSKISNMEPDQEGFKDLNISVVATHKYPMDRSIDILDAQLLDHCSYTSKQKKPKISEDNSDGKSLPFKEQFQPVVPTQQGQTCVPSASQQFQPMVQRSPSNVAMPANLSQPRVPPVTNHVPGLPNDISALSQFQPTSQMLEPVVPGQTWLSFKHQSATFATPVLQTGQQPSVIPSTDSTVTIPGLNQHSSSDWQEISYYYNKRTGESTWDKPPELMSPIEVS
ncbi:pre-mrna-processing protein 40a [Quercus suber]|uniref:Pre-mrna-processing protein 40a n=1 Tax=Quercus suber TaxID=58331 RepID=A0AAW0JMZ9_QUESU